MKCFVLRKLRSLSWNVLLGSANIGLFGKIDLASVNTSVLSNFVSRIGKDFKTNKDRKKSHTHTHPPLGWLTFAFYLNGAGQHQVVCCAGWTCFMRKPYPIFYHSRGMCGVLLSACFLWNLSPRATGFGLTAFQFYFGTKNGETSISLGEKESAKAYQWCSMGIVLITLFLSVFGTSVTLSEHLPAMYTILTAIALHCS